MKEAAGLGAYLEITAGQSNPVEYARVIREVGPGSIILSSDLGQATTPLHPDGLLAFFEALRSEGISREDIRLMSATNSAQVLGLP
jgi:predicted metal-dependent TIM-barrel fold hydrolase